MGGRGKCPGLGAEPSCLVGLTPVSEAAGADGEELATQYAEPGGCPETGFRDLQGPQGFTDATRPVFVFRPGQQETDPQQTLRRI